MDTTAPAPSVPAANPLWGPEWPRLRSCWTLDTAYAHLNHGSFGAVPRVVREAQAGWVRRADANPVRYYRDELPPAVTVARRAAAAFCGTDDDGLAFVANTTAGVSTLLACHRFEPGDEILLTDHAYGAVHRAALRRAEQTGARVVVAALSLGADDDMLAAELLARVTDRTRIALVDQITSPTAMTMPIRSMAAALHDRGVPLLVDGAHAPGMLPLDVAGLGVDFWVGNFHKWAFASRTVAGLWVAPRWRREVRPLVVSWNEGEPFPSPFDQQGTLDLSTWLALPEALAFGAGLGWERVRRHNATLVAAGQQAVAQALRVDLDDVERPAPSENEDPGLAMALVPLPGDVAATPGGVTALSGRVLHELGVEAAITPWGGRAWLRLSAQVYNAPLEYERFGRELARLLGR